MLKSVFIAFLFLALGLALGLALKPSPEMPLPPRDVEVAATPAAQQAPEAEARESPVVEAPAQASAGDDPMDHLEFQPPPADALLDTRRLIEESGLPIPYLANLRGPKLVELLREQLDESIADLDDDTILEATTEASDRARKRLRAAMRVSKMEFDAITKQLDDAGEFTDRAPGVFTKPDGLPRNRQAGVFRKLRDDGSAREYLIDSEKYPALFAAREDRMRLIAESLLFEANAAVRERQALAGRDE